MTNQNSSKNNELQKLSGTIEELRCTRDWANFVFSESEHTALGVVAIAASLVGAAAQAESTATSDMLEEADYLEFSLAGEPVKGWVWRSPFSNGDKVEVVAEWQGDHFEAYAIARPADSIIALYPHCSRGRTSHWINAAKWWLIGSAFTVGLLVTMFLIHSLIFSPSWAKTAKNLSDLIPFSAAVLVLMAFVSTVLLAKRWMSYVRLAEHVFHELGWSSPGTIDLKKRSRRQRRSTDTAEYGVFFFRY